MENSIYLENQNLRISELRLKARIEELESKINELNEQLDIASVIPSACDDYVDGINMDCSKCGRPKYLH